MRDVFWLPPLRRSAVLFALRSIVIGFVLANVPLVFALETIGAREGHPQIIHQNQIDDLPVLVLDRTSWAVGFIHPFRALNLVLNAERRSPATVVSRRNAYVPITNSVVVLKRDGARPIVLDLSHANPRGLEQIVSSGRLWLPRIVRLAAHQIRPHVPQRLSKRTLLERDGHCCAYCGTHLTLSTVTLDHVVPRSKGGATTWDNSVSACTLCNGEKADHDVADFLTDRIIRQLDDEATLGSQRLSDRQRQQDVQAYLASWLRHLQLRLMQPVCISAFDHVGRQVALHSEWRRWGKRHLKQRLPNLPLTRKSILARSKVLWQHPNASDRQSVLTLLETYHTLLKPEDIRLIGTLIRRAQRVSEVDRLAQNVAGPLLLRHGTQTKGFGAWRHSTHPLIRRAMPLALVHPISRWAIPFDALDRLVAPLLGDESLLVRHGTAKSLRELSRHFPAQTYLFLHRHGSRMSVPLVRQSAQLLPARHRAKLLTLPAAKAKW